MGSIEANGKTYETDEEGYLWHVGRLKRFVKIGGEMVSLVRVEGVLEKFLPEDVLCCVVEIPDAMKGARIIAVVTSEIDEDSVQKAIFMGHAGMVRCAAFMSDGLRIVSGSDDRTVRVWNSSCGDELYCLSGHDDLVDYVACDVKTTCARYSRLTWCTIPVSGGTTRKFWNACCPHRRKA